MANTKKRSNKTVIYIKLSGLVLIPIVLLALPADFFDTGQSVCLSVLLADMECYGCGLTRAGMHLIHFEFEEAWMYNKLIFFAFPIIAGLWAAEFFKEIKKLKRHQKPE